MKKYIVTCLVGLCAGLTTARSPFKCTLYDRENKIYLHLDLYEESINVPGMEMFGPMNGYMNGMRKPPHSGCPMIWVRKHKKSN